MRWPGSPRQQPGGRWGSGCASRNPQRRGGACPDPASTADGLEARGGSGAVMWRNVGQQPTFVTGQIPWRYRCGRPSEQAEILLDPLQHREQPGTAHPGSKFIGHRVRPHPAGINHRFCVPDDRRRIPAFGGQRRQRVRRRSRHTGSAGQCQGNGLGEVVVTHPWSSTPATAGRPRSAKVTEPVTVTGRSNVQSPCTTNASASLSEGATCTRDSKSSINL